MLSSVDSTLLLPMLLYSLFYKTLVAVACDVLYSVDNTLHTAIVNAIYYIHYKTLVAVACNVLSSVDSTLLLSMLLNYKFLVAAARNVHVLSSVDSTLHTVVNATIHYFINLLLPWHEIMCYHGYLP